MIEDVPGPDPLKPRVMKQRRAAAMKGWRTRKAMAAARAKHQQDTEVHDVGSTVSDDEQ